jgi:hypothetical protein
MSTSFHTKIAGTIATAFVIVAVATPNAALGAAGGSHAKPQVSVHYSEPGSTGYVAQRFSLPYTEPGSTGYVPRKFSLPYTEPGSTGFVPVAGLASTESASGLDWASTLIGAGIGLGIAFVCAGGLLAVRKHRALANA